MKGGMGGVMHSGFMQMILAVLGVVLYVTMFSTVMTALAALSAVSGIGTFIALTTIIGISPTILLLAGVFGAGFVYYKGYKAVGASGSDPGGIMRMVLGVLMIILFVTLFQTIASSFVTLHTSYGSNTTWIAFGTVLTIVPTILFLSGIFAGVGTGVGGYRARKKRRVLR